MANTQENDARYIQTARENWVMGSNDELEIDDEPAISHGDNGAWVGAWVWVSDEDAGIAYECSQDGCAAMVDPDDPYFSSPCGTYCGYCMKTKHSKECDICASEFDLEGPEVTSAQA